MCKLPIYNKLTMSQVSNYDLEERTAKFGENVIHICKELPQDNITKPLITQLIRSATSVGANYMEANGASSKKDFANKIFISKKESQETKHWLRMLSVAIDNKETINKMREMWKEAQELTLIFQKITNTLRSN